MKKGTATQPSRELTKNEVVNTVLRDGEEVFFQIETDDMWIKLSYRLVSYDNLRINGSVEILVPNDKQIKDM